MRRKTGSASAVVRGMPPKYKFAENEKVLCYHGPLLYEAKVCFVACMTVSKALCVMRSKWNVWPGH